MEIQEFKKNASKIMKVYDLPVGLLNPYRLNAKKHTSKQIETIINSIKRFKFNQPIVIDKEGVIVVGHGRVEAAKKLGMTEVPCVIAETLTEAEIRAYRLIDNKIAEGQWDDELLLSDVKTIDFDFGDFGIKFPEIEFIDTNDEGFDIGNEVLTEIITAPGDVWVLGSHRLMCGDSTNSDHVQKLFNGLNPILMVTDPPYGVEYSPEWREGHNLGVGKRSKGKVANDDRADWTDAYSLFTGQVAYIWHAGKYTHIIAQNLIDCDYKIINQIIWVKQHFAISRGDYHWQHEPCWYAVKKGHKHNWQGARDQSTTWEIKNNNTFGNSEKEETFGHGTQKPLECMLRPILNNSAKGDYVYDPFVGSGTTLVAAEKSGRKCLAMEIDPKYCDMVIRRWQKVTGKDAYLESNSKKFNEYSD